MTRWYVVQTRPGKEQLAEQQLRNQNFLTYCPMRRRLRRLGSQTRMVLAPLFSAYLFVNLDVGRQRWRSVNGTIGVARLVSLGSPGALPTPLPDGLIEGFQALTSADGELHFNDRLEVGDRVRIVGGPFDALCGILENAADGERVTILLDILSRGTRVVIDRGCVAASNV